MSELHVSRPCLRLEFEWARYSRETYAGGLQKVRATAEGKDGLDFVVLDGRFRVAMAMKAYTLLSPDGWVLLGNCDRDAYAEIFNFFDKVRELGGGRDGRGGVVPGDEHERQVGCLLRSKKNKNGGGGGGGGEAAPTDEAAEEIFHVYVTTDGGGHAMGS